MNTSILVIVLVLGSFTIASILYVYFDDWYNNSLQIYGNNIPFSCGYILKGHVTAELINKCKEGLIG